MKKSSFVAMLLGIVSGVLFALGMCMALIPEWNSFKPGVVFGCAGILLGLVTIAIWRKTDSYFRKNNFYHYGRHHRRIGAGRGNVLLYGVG